MIDSCRAREIEGCQGPKTHNSNVYGSRVRGDSELLPFSFLSFTVDYHYWEPQILRGILTIHAINRNHEVRRSTLTFSLPRNRKIRRSV
eukprot:scaffold375_cov175-Skeletonema_dohrnii-CCMP3373.AAC.2